MSMTERQYTALSKAIAHHAKAPCPPCEGRGGDVGLTGGYTVHGSGYGDATPDEGWVDCDVCGGEGDLFFFETCDRLDLRFADAVAMAVDHGHLEAGEASSLIDKYAEVAA